VTKKISSVPILDSTASVSGWVDIIDIVVYTTTKFAKVSTLATESFRQMEEYASKTVKDLEGLSGRDQMSAAVVAPETKLLAVVELLSQPNCHRVVIKSPSKDVLGLITQSRMLEFLYEYRHLVGEMMHKTIRNAFALELKSQQLVTIGEHEFVIAALHKIWENNITGVAVVNEKGKLTANFSASDLKHAQIRPIGGLIHDLYQPLKQFMNIRSTLAEKIMKSGTPKFEPISVKETDTLEKAISLIVEHKIHRIYTVDGEGKPIHVLSLSDILTMFLKEYFISS